MDDGVARLLAFPACESRDTYETCEFGALKAALWDGSKWRFQCSNGLRSRRLAFESPLRQVHFAGSASSVFRLPPASSHVKMLFANPLLVPPAVLREALDFGPTFSAGIGRWVDRLLDEATGERLLVASGSSLGIFEASSCVRPLLSFATPISSVRSLGGGTAAVVLLYDSAQVCRLESDRSSIASSLVHEDAVQPSAIDACGDEALVAFENGAVDFLAFGAGSRSDFLRFDARSAIRRRFGDFCDAMGVRTTYDGAAMRPELLLSCAERQGVFLVDRRLRAACGHFDTCIGSRRVVQFASFGAYHVAALLEGAFALFDRRMPHKPAFHVPESATRIVSSIESGVFLFDTDSADPHHVHIKHYNFEMPDVASLALVLPSPPQQIPDACRAVRPKQLRSVHVTPRVIFQLYDDGSLFSIDARIVEHSSEDAAPAFTKEINFIEPLINFDHDAEFDEIKQHNTTTAFKRLYAKHRNSKKDDDSENRTADYQEPFCMTMDSSDDTDHDAVFAEARELVSFLDANWNVGDVATQETEPIFSQPTASSFSQLAPFATSSQPVVRTVAATRASQPTRNFPPPKKASGFK